MVVKTAPIQYREKSRVSSISLLHGLFTVRVAMEENARAALWTNQVGYITLIAQLPGIYGNQLISHLGLVSYVTGVV